MDRWSTVGWVVLVVGLLLLASITFGMDRDVVARTTVWTHKTYQSRGPVDLPGGSCSFWVEDNPDWPENPSSIDIYLNRSDDLVRSNYRAEMSERTYRDIEGFRCFLVAVISDARSGGLGVEGASYSSSGRTVRPLLLGTPGGRWPGGRRGDVRHRGRDRGHEEVAWEEGVMANGHIITMTKCDARGPRARPPGIG